MPELAELIAQQRILIGILVLSLIGAAGFGFGLLSRQRRLEAEMTPTIREMRAFLRGVRAVRRVRQVRKAQQEVGQRPQ